MSNSDKGGVSESISVQPLIEEQVKLVIWDLDDTFWHGTLSEETITPLQDNIELVKTLASRGIISSICSKNDPVAVEQQLQQMKIWEYFVLPSISFQAKGGSISALIEALNFRPNNVVFIDDNPSVLAEAVFTCPGLVCLSTPKTLLEQLNNDALKGALDEDLTRLAQYQLIAKKYNNKLNSNISEESFLRQSEIKINIDYEIEPHLERIIELINRSNQLNYTKVRIETEEDRREFLKMLTLFGFNAGIVRVWDRYGDYGIVGFFMTLATLKDYKLEHFVFSCRIMNMGVEQYVYNYLNRPEISISEPVANPIESYQKIDWISLETKDPTIVRLRDFKIVLIGGCDMLQLSTYCNCESKEFTNRDQNGLIKRLDDAYFILEDPQRVQESEIRKQIPACTFEEMRELRTALKTTDAVIVAAYRMMEANYFRGSDGLIVRFDYDTLTDILKSEQAVWFVRNFTYIDYSHNERNELIRRCFDRLASSTKADAKIVVLLEETRNLEDNPNELFLKNLYNEFVIKEVARIDKLRYVDVSTATDIAWLYEDGFHMRRQGYLELAKAVMETIAYR